MNHTVFASVTRISELPVNKLSMRQYPRENWRTGDYVVGKVIATNGRLHGIELPNGRMMEAMDGDLVVGALGARAATLEAVGDWRAMDSDVFEALTPAGLFGKLTSISPFLTPLMRLQYQGHALTGGRRTGMQGALPEQPHQDFNIPVILIVGTSMSAGKTLSGRLIVHLLTQLGLRVVGLKITGAARYRDVLSYADAGAVAVFDFVDAGLPSTVCSEQDYRRALDYLLSRVATLAPDVVVAEAGASPLEPYNGKTALQILGDQIKFELLCAQDPYAVVGVKSAFAREPNLVAGGAANTSAGIQLVRKLADLPALNLLDPASHSQLCEMLSDSLSLAIKH